MAKVYNFPNNILQIDFSYPHGDFEIYWQKFLSSELGRIYQAIPWKDLSKLFIKNTYERRGKDSTFTIQGKLALMFLKSYLGCSDKQLMERLTTDYALQFFCQRYFRVDEKLPGYKIISDIRCELAGRLKVKDAQLVLAKAWAPYMKDTHAQLQDATCYETHMRYPTDVKLLWECSEWTYGQISRMCKVLGCRMPRSRFSEQKDKYLAYQRNRKKSYKKRRKRVRSLLYLADKLNGQLEELEQMLPVGVTMPGKYYQRREVIKQVLVQQTRLFEKGERSKGMIVSIDKSYIRPIVRGKETKRVEFGAKVNKIQIDGISFIEHLSFEAFHEGNRLKYAVWLHRDLFGKCTHLAGDQIYATNVNRTYCTQEKITTSFVRKGKPSKDEAERQQIRSILSKERATRLEGSFGTEKNHYGLQRIAARTKKTEILWIFFGIHTANSVEIAKRISAEQIPRQQAA